jgi:hypothetical protein
MRTKRLKLVTKSSTVEESQTNQSSTAVPEHLLAAKQIRDFLTRPEDKNNTVDPSSQTKNELAALERDIRDQLYTLRVCHGRPLSIADKDFWFDNLWIHALRNK